MKATLKWEAGKTWRKVIDCLLSHDPKPMRQRSKKDSLAFPSTGVRCPILLEERVRRDACFLMTCLVTLLSCEKHPGGFQK